MRVTDIPCKGCNKRYLGCHDHCGSYQAVRKKIDEVNKARYEANFYNYLSQRQIKSMVHH